MDVISIIIGMGIMLLFIFIYGNYLVAKRESVKQVELDGTFERKIFCPECGSYNLTLTNIRPVWMKQELDYYECNKCGKHFSDGD